MPLPHNEAERLKALKRYQILDTAADEDFDRITRIASLICDTPISLVSLLDEDRQWFKSRIGLDVSETAREIAFCSHAIMDNRIFEVEDATRDERFRENILVTSDPNIRFYAGYPLIDPNGFPLGTLCVIDRKSRKLTETQQEALRLLAEEAISLIVNKRRKKELENFEKLFQLSSDLICIAGIDGYFKKINPAFRELLNWDESFLLKTSFLELIHPDDLDNTRREIKEIEKGHNTINFVNRYRKPDGDYVTLQWVATPEPDSDTFFAIARDITDEINNQVQLEESERRFRSFFENSQGLMCTHDLDGVFLRVNTAGAAILGYTPADVIGHSLFDIIPKERHELVHEYLERIKTEGHASGLMTTLHRNGSTKIWMYNNTLEKGADGVAYVIGNSIDITERHKLEMDLQSTKQLLEHTNRIARMGAWEISVPGGNIVWSEMTREIHEVDPDFVPVADNVTGFFEEGPVRDKIVALISETFLKGTPFDIELPIITARGNKRWIRIIGNAEIVNGQPVRVYGAFQDINDKKQVELEVSNSRKLVTDIIQAAPDIAIVATDLRGVITVFNAGAEKMLGYTAEEMVGKQTPATFHLPEEMQAYAEDLSKEYKTHIDGFRAFVYKALLEGYERREWTYRRKDGSTFVVSLVMTAIRDVNNNITGYLGLATDLSERKKAEEAINLERSRLLAFVEHAPAAVAMFDRNLHYVAASNRWMEEYRLYGQNLIGRSHYEVFPNISQHWKDIHQRSLQGEVMRYDEDIWRPDGWDHDQYLRWEVRPWYQLDGQIGGIMMFTQDITEMCLQREELRVSKVNAEQASVAKSEFLANMSHEIRTPLNGVIGFTDLVLKTRLEQTQKQYLTIVNQSANALLSIINDILDFSKIEAGKLELDIDKSDLFAMCSEAADIITYQAQSKGLEMLLNISMDLPRFIWADSVRLKQVLINLLGNAVKFTEKGEIELKIETLSRKPSGEVEFRFEVRDTGIGIKKEKQDKIFEAFSQEDSSTTKKYGGTGLGLTISNKLLALMGSKLQLRSQPGKGSSFFFDITLKAEEGEPIVWENIDQVKHVLIVDDNDNNRTILKQMLLLRNISSDEARNGLDALQLLASGNHYDVVLMDYHMPIMDGLETIRKIRQNFHATAEEQPILLLYSSSDDEKVIRACEELQVNHRLVKPIKMKELYTSLAQLRRMAEYEPAVEKAGMEQHEVPLRVLIAEDNQVNMLLAKTIIKRIAPNAVLLEAATGLEAAQLSREAKPDLIFMDVQMPEMNGYEATEIIRREESGTRVPIIALTAGNVKGERERCMEAGMDDFVAKPVVEEDISQVFNKWVERGTTPPAVETSSLAGIIDMEHIKQYVGNEPGFLREFLSLTRKELLLSLEEINKGINSNNLPALNAIGHKLNGTALTSGLKQLSGMASELEHLQPGHDDRLRELQQLIQAEVDKILAAIGKQLEKT